MEELESFKDTARHALLHTESVQRCNIQLRPKNRKRSSPSKIPGTTKTATNIQVTNPIGQITELQKHEKGILSLFDAQET